MAPKIDYSMRLPAGEFSPAARKKSGIAIHHTVGGTAFSTFDYWLKDRSKAGNRRIVGTAFIIDRDGTIYQVFEPTAWAFQFGVKWQPARQKKFEQRFIGIELASEGGLTEFNDKLYCFDRISPKTVKPRDEAFDYLDHYRGYRFFDRYESVQMDRLVDLINHLCDTYSIERQVPCPPIDYYGERLFDFKGIIGHAMVRRDKSDPAPDVVSLWERLIKDCKLTVISIPKAPQPEAIHLSDQELDRVFEGNMRQIGKMATAAGSMVKGLIMELERRDTYIRLHGAEAGGHKIHYQLLVGNESLVKRLAAALGLQHVTPSTLQKDSIQAVVTANAALQQSMQCSREDKAAEATVLRDYVNLLEQQRQQSAFTVRQIRKTL